MLRKSLLGLLVLLIALAGVLALNTWRKPSRQVDVAAIAPIAVAEADVAARLGEAVRLKTISSRDDAGLHAAEFKRFHDLLRDRFPKVHASLQREVISDLSLLYTWPGRNSKADPILLMAHLDVVPVAPGTEKDWTVDAFSGEVRDGFVWGRGAWDDKVNVMAQLEAIELLLAAGHQPERTVLLAFGADEEVGGLRGAARIAATLKARGVRLHMVLDEGLLLTESILSGLDKPVALIGIAEKGYMSVVLRMGATPGHSSMPPARGTSAIAMMSAALKRIDDEQMPGGIRGVAAEMFDTIAPEMSGFSRVALSNLWLFGPLVQKQLEAKASTNAMLRTTAALTIVQAGNKENVLPGVAEATVNYRLLPGDRKDAMVERLRQQVAAAGSPDKFELFVLPGAVEASKVAPTESAQYQLIQRTIREVFPDTLVAPGLMIGGTDSMHFGDISDHIFKFSPVRARNEDLARFHGTNERISTRNLVELVRFYHRLISQAAQAAST